MTVEFHVHVSSDWVRRDAHLIVSEASLSFVATTLPSLIRKTIVTEIGDSANRARIRIGQRANPGSKEVIVFVQIRNCDAVDVASLKDHVERTVERKLLADNRTNGPATADSADRPGMSGAPRETPTAGEHVASNTYLLPPATVESATQELPDLDSPTPPVQKQQFELTYPPSREETLIDAVVSCSPVLFVPLLGKICGAVIVCGTADKSLFQAGKDLTELIANSPINRGKMLILKPNLPPAVAESLCKIPDDS